MIRMTLMILICIWTYANGAEEGVSLNKLQTVINELNEIPNDGHPTRGDLSFSAHTACQKELIFAGLLKKNDACVMVFPDELCYADANVTIAATQDRIHGGPDGRHSDKNPT